MQRAGLVATLPLPKKVVRRGPLARPVERLLETIARANLEIATPGAETKLPVRANASRTRAAMFQVQALLRMLGERFGGPFDVRLQRADDLENALGGLSHAQDMFAVAERTGQADLMNHWAHRETVGRARLVAVLRKRWLPDSAGAKAETNALVGDILDLKKKLDTDDDTRQNAKALLREVERVTDARLDMRDLHDIHKLRRLGRKFVVLARALSGAVVLTDAGTPERFRHYLTSPAAKLERADELPSNPRESNPVRVSRALWIGVAYVSDALHAIKDQCEAYDALREALIAQRGMKPGAAHREALRLLGLTEADVAGWTQKAAPIYAEAKDLFLALAHQLREQAKNA